MADRVLLAASSRAQIRLVSSADDPYSTDGPAAEVDGRPLGLDPKTLQGAGHLTIDDGYGPWSAVHRWRRDGSSSFTA